MIWESWSAFFAMGGYGLYVWGSLVVTFGVLFVEVAVLAAQRKSILAQHRRWIRNNRKERNEN